MVILAILSYRQVGALFFPEGKLRISILYISAVEPKLNSKIFIFREMNSKFCPKHFLLLVIG